MIMGHPFKDRKRGREPYSMTPEHRAAIKAGNIRASAAKRAAVIAQLEQV